MNYPEIEARLYTLPINPGDIVCLHLEYEMNKETQIACSEAFTQLLRNAGKDNIFIILQPGMALTTASGEFANS